jgi:oleate hydratase
MDGLRDDDRLVVGTASFAFIGQYCEIPDDVVFTVEYSVRSAQTAVFSLLGLETAVSPLYKGQHDPAVLFGAAKAFVR